MAIHKSLLLGPGVKGTIGKQITFSKWKGISIAKTMPIPSNPNTAAQQGVRNAFKALVTEWHNLGRTIVDAEAYDVSAGRDSRPMSGFNLFVSIYMLVHKDDDTEQFFVDGSATRVTTTVTVAATVTGDFQCKAVCYNKFFVPVAEATGTPTAGALSIDVTVPASVTEGYARIFSDNAGYGGSSGHYAFD